MAAKEQRVWRPSLRPPASSAPVKAYPDTVRAQFALLVCWFGFFPLIYLLSFVILSSLQDLHFFMFQLPYKPLEAPINTNINVLIMHTDLRCRITYFYKSSALYRVQ